MQDGHLSLRWERQWRNAIKQKKKSKLFNGNIQRLEQIWVTTSEFVPGITFLVSQPTFLTSWIPTGCPHKTSPRYVVRRKARNKKTVANTRNINNRWITNWSQFTWLRHQLGNHHQISQLANRVAPGHIDAQTQTEQHCSCKFRAGMVHTKISVAYISIR